MSTCRVRLVAVEGRGDGLGPVSRVRRRRVTAPSRPSRHGRTAAPVTCAPDAGPTPCVSFCVARRSSCCCATNLDGGKAHASVGLVEGPGGGRFPVAPPGVLGLEHADPRSRGQDGPGSRGDRPAAAQGVPGGARHRQRGRTFVIQRPEWNELGQDRCGGARGDEGGAHGHDVQRRLHHRRICGLAGTAGVRAGASALRRAKRWALRRDRPVAELVSGRIVVMMVVGRPGRRRS